MIKIAVDVCVPRAYFWKLRDRGYAVSCIADHSEPDEEWFERALVMGVEAVITTDAEVQFWARSEGLEVVDPIGNGQRMIEFILMELDRKLK